MTYEAYKTDKAYRSVSLSVPSGCQVGERMRQAKTLMTRAAVAALRGWPMAEQMAAHALAELEAARTEYGEQRRVTAGSATRPDPAAPARSEP